MLNTDLFGTSAIPTSDGWGIYVSGIKICSPNHPGSGITPPPKVVHPTANAIHILRDQSSYPRSQVSNLKICAICAICAIWALWGMIGVIEWHWVTPFEEAVGSSAASITALSLFHYTFEHLSMCTFEHVHIQTSEHVIVYIGAAVSSAALITCTEMSLSLHTQTFKYTFTHCKMLKQWDHLNIWACEHLIVHIGAAASIICTAMSFSLHTQTFR